jgi:hypothetical protein
MSEASGRCGYQRHHPMEPDLTYKAHPIKVLDHQHEEFLRSNYPEFAVASSLE